MSVSITNAELKNGKRGEILNNLTAGEKIQLLRKKKGLTQTELARLVSVSPAAISMYESNTRVPTDPVKVKLADVLGRTVGYIFFK